MACVIKNMNCGLILTWIWIWINLPWLYQEIPRISFWPRAPVATSPKTVFWSSASAWVTLVAGSFSAVARDTSFGNLQIQNGSKMHQKRIQMKQHWLTNSLSNWHFIEKNRYEVQTWELITKWLNSKKTGTEQARLPNFPHNICLGTFTWKTSHDNLRLGSLVWKLSSGIFHFGTFVWNRRLGNFISELFTPQLSDRDLSLWNFRLGSFACAYHVDV